MAGAEGCQLSGDLKAGGQGFVNARGLRRLNIDYFDPLLIGPAGSPEEPVVAMEKLIVCNPLLGRFNLPILPGGHNQVCFTTIRKIYEGSSTIYAFGKARKTDAS